MKKKANTRFYVGFMASLISVFTLYNFTVYTKENTKATKLLSQKALKGQVLWQNNICFSCHQLYGLGGYLGPDLTNTFSDPKKGPDYIKAYINSGIKTMPRFNLSENEKEELVTFLKEVDQSGYYPNYEAIIEPTGWVTIKYKNEK